MYWIVFIKGVNPLPKFNEGGGLTQNPGGLEL